MRDLNHDFKNLCRRNRDGSFATQHDRESILTLIANQLDEDGFAGAGSLIPAEMSYPGPAQPLQVADGGGRHRPRAWVAAPQRADALCRADGLEGACSGRADRQAVEPGPKADR